MAWNGQQQLLKLKENKQKLWFGPYIKLAKVTEMKNKYVIDILKVFHRHTKNIYSLFKGCKALNEF